MKKNLMVLLFMFLAGCSSLKEQSLNVYNNSEEHLVIEDRKYMSCDADYYQRGRDYSGSVHGGLYESIANQTFLYALMSSNAYDDQAQFEIIGWNRIRHYKRWNGFSVDVWQNDEKNEVVVAYRGTEFLQPQDWIFGNFNIFWKGQYKDAEELIDDIAIEFKEHKITATGHSLGGALAMHASLYKNGIEAFVFNASPRVFNSNEYANNDNRRVVISEKDEILEVFRKRWPSLKYVSYEGSYNEFDFIDDFSIEHSSYYLARGILAVSASTGNDTARKLMRTNFGCEFKSKI